jgi:membrane-bound lytic murein transglycosylase B
MQAFGWFKAVAVSLLFTQWMGTAANAAQCGTSAAGFEYWKQQFAEEARGRIGGAAIAALMSTQYGPATISADRGQRSFHLSLDQFLAKRGAPAIAARGAR